MSVSLQNIGKEAALYQHLDWCRTRGLRPSTIYQRRGALFRFREKTGIDVLEATKDQAEAWWLGLAGTAHTRAVELSHVQQYVRWAIRHGMITGDPTARIDRPRVGRRMPRPISEERLRVAMAHANARLGWMLTVAAYCGLRCCEIAAVEWGHIMSSPDGPILEVPEGKGGHSRIVPLHAEAAAALERMPGVRRGYVLARKDGHHGPVRPAQVSKEINEFLHGLGVTDTAHSLRHRFGTGTFRESKDIVLVKGLMGHQSINTTQGYVQFDASRAHEIVGRLPPSK